MTSHLSIYVIINLKFSIVKLPKGIMAERSVLVKRELISNLPEARRSQRETIPYICDFSRCRLNVRLPARIQPLLRGHKYRVSALFGSCLLAAHENSGFILRKIWGRLQTVVTFWGIEMLEDWHLSYHFKLFDIITIFGRFPEFIHSPYNFFAFFSIFNTNYFVFPKNKFINTL